MASRTSRKRSSSRPSRRTQPSQEPTIETDDAKFPLVAVGASAGGLEAFRILLSGIPPKSGMSFILVQHLDPTHPSMMVELLIPHTGMKVIEAREGARLERDHVYTIPAGRYLSVRDGALHLSRAPDANTRQTVRMPFDFLLQSLVEEGAERTVGIILSGTATDGTIGAKLLKNAGGLIIAQDPEEAEYEGMPQSAIASGAVDLVLRLADIPKALARYAGHRYVKADKNDTALPLSDGIAQIVDLLRKKTSHDFALYKEGTIGRRIERRMAMAGTEDSKRYLEQLIQDPEELQRLANDLFINVTRFFRDTKAFDLLAQKIIPDLVRAHPSDRPIRIWVAGCSTGEEAYSLAILILEEIAATQRKLKLQVFASDVDANAIGIARDGLYPASIESDIPSELLARYFTREDQGYRVSRELRATIAFSIHDLTADAPFSRLDFVSCRNLLIYLRPEVQQKVIAVFHFALREGGVLFLGASETVGRASNNFAAISKTLRIYSHIGRTRPGDVDLPLGRGETARSLWLRRPISNAKPRGNIADLMHRLLIERYAPASVLATSMHKGLYFSGPVDRFLKLSTGVGSLDLLASAREGLRPAIRTAFEKVREGSDKVITVSSHMKHDASTVPVVVRAEQIKSDGEELILLSFSDAPPQREESEGRPDSIVDVPRLTQFEQELDTMRKELEAAIHDREAAEEEIRAINEEAMSVNEEFQTTNEELETSKEELQSLNEELTALNTQLQETADQHKVVANDLENILNSTDTATLFLDDKLNIRFFTPAAKLFFSVISSDVGRPLADLARHFVDENLFNDVHAVLTKFVPITREISGEDNSWHTRRILPYRTKNNFIEGVVITFTDITARKRAEDAANSATLLAENASLGKSRFLAAASHDLRQPLQTLVLLQGLLAKTLTDADALKLVARSDEALAAMSGMLNTLLDINQLEAGVIRPVLTDFPINNLLEHIKSEFAYHAQVRGLDLRFIPCREAVHSDSRLLEQMIRNLLSNAVKYTKKGGVLLGCRRRNGKLRIEIWDTGLGIPESQLSSIFKEFYQIDNPGRELSRGLGLGLSIVHRLGELLGHRIDVRSRHGVGSVFAIELGLAQDDKAIVRERIEQESNEIAVRAGVILVVEDDPDVRNSLEAFLKADGHRILAATDGDDAAAISIRDGIRPDAIIVDYNLPAGQNGVDVVTRLRQTLGHNLPALVLTGDISAATLNEIHRHGYTHRSKPINAADLTFVVQQLLNSSNPSPVPSVPGQTTEIRPNWPATIFIVDDNHSVRDSLRALLEAEGMTVKCYASGPEFFAANSPDSHGCLLIDAGGPGVTGLQILQRLKVDNYRLPAIMITGDGDVRIAVQAIKAGAIDFIQKPISRSELLASIKTATAESTTLSDRREGTAKRVFALNAREREILDLILAGQPNKNIAADLGITERTVERHRAVIMKKTGAKSLAALVRLTIAST